MHYKKQYVWARAMSIDGEEIEGCVMFRPFERRKHLYKLWIPLTNKTVLVDPMTVELYTGIDDAETGERIYEGDIIRLRESGIRVNSCARAAGNDALCEVFLPFNPNDNLHKRLYVHNVEGVSDMMLSIEFIKQIKTFDKLNWVKVGRADDEEFGLPTDRSDMVKLKLIHDHPGGTIARMVEPTKKIWTVEISDNKDLEACRFFGTYFRRKGIITTMYEDDFYRMLSQCHASFKKLWKKWDKDYQKYLMIR